MSYRSIAHTPTPWFVEPTAAGNAGITSATGDIGKCQKNFDDAAFIVLACNAHDALVAALAQIARLSSEGEVSANMQYALGDIARAALAKVTP